MRFDFLYKVKDDLKVVFATHLNRPELYTEILNMILNAWPQNLSSCMY